MVLAERARLSREIHDTLLQSLVGVALQVDAISNTLDSSSSGARRQLVRIRRQVEAYIREARQSIWDLRSPVLETHDLHAALREFGKRATAGKPVRFATSVTGTPRQCSAKVENQLLRIGQEAITNAVRHADAKRIHLELTFDDRAVGSECPTMGVGSTASVRRPTRTGITGSRPCGSAPRSWAASSRSPRRSGAAPRSRRSCRSPKPQRT